MARLTGNAPGQPGGTGAGSRWPGSREPGWYSDPAAPGHWRWWDGRSWTGHAAQAYGDEPPPAPAPPGPPAAADAAARLFVRRWAALAGVVLLLIVVVAIAVQGAPPALYWQGRPMANAAQALALADSAMKSVVADDEGQLAADAGCYFSLPGSSAHDVGPAMECGPLVLPWSGRGAAWLSFPLSARLSASGQAVLAVRTSPPPSTTAALAAGEVLRRPGGASPAPGTGGLSLPRVPRQPAGWAGLLVAPPLGLAPAPVGTLIGDWSRSYRLVAFGEQGHLPARLDESGLADAVVPAGSSYGATGAGRGGKRGRAGRPPATLLLPAPGQVFAVAELAVSRGGSAGPVPSGAGTPSPPPPQLQVLAGPSTSDVPVSTASSGEVTVVASVAAGARPMLVVTDKGLVQEVSLSDGRLLAGPSILSRTGTDEALSVTGRVGRATVHFSDASLVWFAGSDGGTVPPRRDEAYLEVLATASPAGASFLPSSDFTLQVPGAPPVPAQALPDADRAAILVGFVVPASFSGGTVVLAAGGRPLDVPVYFP